MFYIDSSPGMIHDLERKDEIPMDKKTISALLDQKAGFLNSLSDQIWENPELAFTEHASAHVLIRGG